MQVTLANTNSVQQQTTTPVTKTSKRYKIFQELYMTQLDYLKDLNLILTEIRSPLLASKLINPDQSRILFSSLEQMVSLSQDFSATLQNIFESWDEDSTMIGKRISYYNEYFKIYRQYCSTYGQKLKIIKRVRKSPLSQKIQKTLRLREYQSYMVKPIQRPVKYHLLLNQYLKATPENHEDIQFIEQAITKYKEVNSQNNSFIENLQKNQKVKGLEQKYKIFNNRVLPTILKTFRAKEDVNNQKFEVHILEDLIVLENIKENKCMKIDLDGGSFVQPCMDGKYFANRVYVGGNTVSVHLDFKSYVQKMEFAKCLKKVIHKLFTKQWNKKDLELEKKKTQKCILKSTLISSVAFKATIYYPPKPRISCYQVDSKLSQITLKISVPNPNSSCQMISLDLQDFFIFCNALQNNFLVLNQFEIDRNHKFKTVNLEPRVVIFQRFLNFVFRSEKILRNFQNIWKVLGIQQELWKFLTSQDYECSCTICSQFIGNNLLKFYKNILRINKEQYFKTYETLCQASLSNPSNGLQAKKCVFYAFTIQKSLSMLPLSQFKDLDDKMIYIWNYLGRLDYMLLPRFSVYCNHEMLIFLPNISKQDVQIKVKYHEKMTVGQILEIAGRQLGLTFVKDFSLVLCRKSKAGNFIKQKVLHGDEQILNINAIIDPENHQDKGNVDQTSSRKRAATDFVHNLKQAISTAFHGNKFYIVLFKTIFLDVQTQQHFLQKDPIRPKLFADEIFYSFVKEPSQTLFDPTAKLLAIYYIKNSQIKSKKEISKKHIQKVVKKIVVHPKTLELFSVSKFMTQVLDMVLNFQKYSMEQLNMIVVFLGYQMKIWGQIYFPIIKYDPKMIEANNCQKNILLSFTGSGKIEVTHAMNKIWTIKSVQIKEGTYKVSLKQIFLKFDQEWLQLECETHGSLKYLLEIYKIARKKFDCGGENNKMQEHQMSMSMISQT